MPDLNIFVRRFKLLSDEGIIAVGAEYPSGYIELEYVDHSDEQAHKPRRESYPSGMGDVRKAHEDAAIDWLD